MNLLCEYWTVVLTAAYAVFAVTASRLFASDAELCDVSTGCAGGAPAPANEEPGR
jgi:hypothetical protein